MDDMNWSDEVYRLDQVAYKCQLPCVIKVLEGIYSDTEAESVSAGDIIKLDKHTRIPKVEAKFVEEYGPGRWKATNREAIFVPVNYKGKVKVVHENKQYGSIEELVRDFPKFASVTSPLVVERENKTKVTIEPGQTIELDRLIPGCVRGGRKEPDKLVIQFVKQGTTMVFGVPCNRPGRFASKPDTGEYTLKEVIERYQLPKVVTFLKSDLRDVYMENLVDVAENMRTITDTVRLERLVSTEVLIGHYKPVEEVAPAAPGDTVSRTLVVLPLEAEFVRELEVVVLQDATEEDYERLELVRPPSRAVQAVEEMIYVDFARAPGIIRLDENLYDNTSAGDSKTYDYAETLFRRSPAPPELSPDRPPPRPPKSYPGQPLKPVPPTPAAKPKPPATKPKPNPKPVTISEGHASYVDMSQGHQSSPIQHVKPTPQGHRVLPTSSSPHVLPTPPTQTVQPTSPVQIVQPAPQSPSDTPDGTEADDYIQPEKPQQLEFSLASIDFSQASSSLERQKKQGFFSKVKEKIYLTHKDTKPKSRPTSPVSPSVVTADEDDDDDYYEDIDESLMSGSISGAASKARKNEKKPRAIVSPNVTRPTESAEKTIPFMSLSVPQLYERLATCGMKHLAEICKEESLDGPFICTMDNDSFKAEPFNLSDFDLKKLERIKHNWVPK